jgi:hypothetical protein
LLGRCICLQDTAYLGVFAFSVSVELVVQNLQAPGDLAYFALTVRLGFTVTSHSSGVAV